jgi:hypothetical protein
MNRDEISIEIKDYIKSVINKLKKNIIFTKNIAIYKKLSKTQIENLWINLNTQSIHKDACDYFCSFFKSISCRTCF